MIVRRPGNAPETSEHSGEVLMTCQSAERKPREGGSGTPYRPEPSAPDI